LFVSATGRCRSASSTRASSPSCSSSAPSKGNPAGLEADRDRQDRAGFRRRHHRQDIRRTATVHGIISFVFNTALLALMVNIAASAI
jgi:hypothetical protein